MKRIETETEKRVSPIRDHALTTVSDEGDNSEERGGFEAK